jgi:hypothetical protein
LVREAESAKSSFVSGSSLRDVDCDVDLLGKHAAQGLWMPVVLNWMTHTYPEDKEKWGGMDMQMEAGAPDAGVTR